MKMDDLPRHECREFHPKKSPYLVIIPVLNEGERIRKQLDSMKDLISNFDTVIVDGGSTDGSLERVEDSGLQALLRLESSDGLSAQLRVGLFYGMGQGYDGVILIDGNNKDNPAAIPSFASALEAGVDHVQGSRFVKGGRAINTPWRRLLGVRLIHAPLISLAARFWYTDTTNGFRAYSRRLLLDPRVQPFRPVFLRYELHYYLAIRAPKLKFVTQEIPVERSYPRGKVPSKMKGLLSELSLLRTLWSAITLQFDPTKEQIDEACASGLHGFRREQSRQSG